jgi:hypothetical protein
MKAGLAGTLFPAAIGNFGDKNIHNWTRRRIRCRCIEMGVLRRFGVRTVCARLTLVFKCHYIVRWLWVWLVVFLGGSSVWARLNPATDATDNELQQRHRAASADAHRRHLLFLGWKRSCPGKADCKDVFGIPGHMMHGNSTANTGECIELCIFSDWRQVWHKVYWKYDCGYCEKKP